MKNDTFLIHLQIGSLRLPLRIARDDEEVYRRAEKFVVETIDKMQKNYSNFAHEDILKLAAFQLAVAIAKNEMTIDTQPLADKIEALNKELEQLLPED